MEPACFETAGPPRRRGSTCAWLESFLGQQLHPEGVDAEEAGFQSFADHLVPIIEERRTRPGADVLSAIVSGSVSNRPVTQDEAINMCTSLIIGGLDTTQGCGAA